VSVTNPTSASICIPTGTLAADSGSIKAYRDGKEFSSPNNMEAPDQLSGAGPFYIVSKDSSAVMPVDEGGLKLKSGKYLFRANLMWMQCDHIVSGRSYPSIGFQRREVQSLVLYQPFG
jgi:hypothetical protein